MLMIVASLASYDKRVEYLEKTLPSILSQTLSFDKLLINIPSETSSDLISRFRALEKLDSRVEVKLRDGGWRSANKLIFTSQEYPEAVIITCDDDIFYPKHFFEALYSKWVENSECIIAHEISPVYLNGDKLQYISGFDVKLLQKTFGRYLTGCCLFPPHALEGTEAYDFDKYKHVTNCTHDELWFWIHTTLKGIQCIGLNYTYSFDGDDVVLPRDDNSLSKINSDPYLKSYNEKINEVYGEKLVKILKEQVCEFQVTRDSLLGICGNLQRVQQIYGQYQLKFNCCGLVKSQIGYLVQNLRSFLWMNKVEVKTND